jgi:transcription antitermination factor NusG
MSSPNNDIWHVVYTKSRNEKKVLKKLLDLGIECYCPLRKTLKQWSDRKKWVEEPIFKSYIFVKSSSSQEKKLTILNVEGVVRFLNWLGAPAQVRQEEINIIKKFLGEYKDVNFNRYDLGATVKVKTGSLKGQIGVVTESTDRHITLTIEKLGMNLTAKLPIYQVSD